MATGQMSEVLQHLRRVVLRPDGAGLSDGQLLERYVSRREEAAVAALVKRHGPMVWGVCRRVLPNHHDAEDAFQATFLVLVRKAASIVPREMVANWLYGVAHQTALKARATAARRKGRERQVAAMPEPAAGQELWRELQGVLDEELSRLPDKYRVVLILCDLGGKTRKEAARQLGVPEGTVAGRLARARAILARRIARHGLWVSGAALATALVQGVASASVPPSVLASTVRATSVIAAGQAAGLVSARAAALAEGVLKMMLVSKLNTAAAVLAGTLGLVIGLGLCAYPGFGRQPASENKAPAKEERGARAAGQADDKRSEARYCRLVFGPKRRVRVLVRLDGEEVAVDRNGDGKFDGKGERFKSEKDCKGVVIADPDGKTTYVITRVHVLHVVPPEKFLAVRVHNRGPLDYTQEGVVQMTEGRKDAPEAHFNGPLTIGPKTWTIEDRASHLVGGGMLGAALPNSLKQLAGKTLYIESELPSSLARAGEPTKLCAGIATTGESSLVAVVSPDDKDGEKSPLPRGVRPFVDVEFPPKKQGDPPVKKRYPLDHVRGGIFLGPVRVPGEAGAGKARVTFSCDGWKGAKVAPTTVRIPIDDSPQGKQ